MGSSQAESANLTLQKQMLVARGISCTSNCMRSWSQGPLELGVTQEMAGGAPHTELGVTGGADTSSGAQLSPKIASGRSASPLTASVFPSVGWGITPSHRPHERKVSVGTWLVTLQSEPFCPSSSLSVFSAQCLVPPPPPPWPSPACFPLYSHICPCPACCWLTLTALPHLHWWA